MSYIDEWDNYKSPSFKIVEDDIKRIDSQIKHLQNIRKTLKKRKQAVCPHYNIVRKAHMPRLSYADMAYMSPDATVKVTTTCADCGKVLSK